MRLLLVILGFCVTHAYADGLSPMPLNKVLPRADVVVVAEIVSHDGAATAKKDGQRVKSVLYSYNIRFRVTEEVKGKSPENVELRYEFTVVKGVWLAWPGSGLESQMKAGEKYVLLLESRGGRMCLLRAERETALKSVKDMLAKQAKQEAVIQQPAHP